MQEPQLFLCPMCQVNVPVPIQYWSQYFYAFQQNVGCLLLLSFFIPSWFSCLRDNTPHPLLILSVEHPLHPSFPHALCHMSFHPSASCPPPLLVLLPSFFSLIHQQAATSEDVNQIPAEINQCMQSHMQTTSRARKLNFSLFHYLSHSTQIFIAAVCLSFSILRAYSYNVHR